MSKLTYTHGKKSSIGPAAPSARGFAWILDRLASSKGTGPIELRHADACIRCGRALTTPES